MAKNIMRQRIRTGDADDYQKIDNMPYQSMLALWRNAPSGHPWFQYGPVFDYFDQSMKKKRALVGDAGHTAASKNIGWG
jgi:hypothetical protein